MIKKNQVALITSFSISSEVERICEELFFKGYKPTIWDVSDAYFRLGNGLKEAPPFLVKGDLPQYAIIRGVFSYLKKTAFLVNYLKSKGVKVFDNNFLNEMYSINKVLDLLKLSLAEVPIPKTVFTRTGFKDFKSLSTKTFNFPFIVKRVNKGKGAGVYIMRNSKELNSFLKKEEYEGRKSKHYIAQQLVDYKHDLRILIIGDQVFCMERIPSKGEFRANFSLGGSVRLFKLDDDLKQLALKAREAIGLTIAGVDILIDKTGKKYVLEVNHTPGFLGMEKATGKNIGHIFVETAFKNMV